MSLALLPTEVSIARILATKPGELRVAARAFEAAEDELFAVRGRMNGVIADTHAMWDSIAGRSFATASEEVVGGLGQVGYTLGYLARQLRTHADATDQALAELEPFRTAHPPPGQHPYWQADAIKQSQIDGVAARWHVSETRVRDALWTRGEQAPGGLPVPDLPIRPEPSWFEQLFGPGPEWTWLDAEGDPLPQGHDGTGGFGYDEDGNLVPVHRATYPEEHYYLQQLGLPLGAIFRWVARTPGARLGVANGDEFIEAVQASKGWRGQVDPDKPEAPAHRWRHIWEFFDLKIKPGEKLPPWAKEGDDPLKPPPWAETEYLNTLRRAAESSGKVFHWSTAGSPTNAILHRDPATQKWLVVQFYREGTFAGQYATSFTPTAAQIQAMLQANALK
jgi:hypothetical protein